MDPEANKVRATPSDGVGNHIVTNSSNSNSVHSSRVVSSSSSASRSSNGLDDVISVGVDSTRVASSSSQFDSRILVDSFSSSSRSNGVANHRVFRDINLADNASNVGISDGHDNRDLPTHKRSRRRYADDDNEDIDNIEVDGDFRGVNRVGSRDGEAALRNRIESSRRDAVRFYHLGPVRDLNVTSAVMKERRRELNRRIRRRVHNVNNADDVAQQNIENNNTVNIAGTAGPIAHYNLFLEHQEGVIDIDDFMRLLGTNINANMNNNEEPYVVDEDFNALLDDVSNGNVDAIKQYIESGCDVNNCTPKGHTLLAAAALKNNTVMMEMLIAAGASINAVNKSGSTALIQAAHFGNEEAVQLLLSNNASCDIVNKNGTSALMRASQEGRVGIAKMLLNAKADVNRKNKEGMNSLMLASQRNHAEVVSLLIQSGANCDDQTVQGSTALMLASKRGHLACVDVLITMGAEVHILDSRDRTARDSALRKNFLTVLPYLDTQFQMNRMRQRVSVQRSHFIVECRNAYAKGKLQLRYDPNLSNKATSSSHFITFNAPDCFNYLKKTTSDVICTVHAAGAISHSTINTLLKLKASMWSSHRQRFECDDYQWPLLLVKCMALPNGVFDLINDYLPLPRMWGLNLRRLRQRCKLAPRQAMADSSIISDEILADSCIFSSSCQSMLATRISRNPLLYHELQVTGSMPSSVLQVIDYIADIQSILSRTLDSEIIVKPQLAKKLLWHVTALCRWYNRESCVEDVIGITDDAVNAVDSETEAEADAPDLDDDDSDASI